MKRACGILMHISSLPSKYGIGSLGKDAYDFVDFLSKSGQSYWQVLPIGPTGYADSPYQSFSTFAGNPYFIDLDILCDEHLLEKNEYQNIDWGKSESFADYSKIYKFRFNVLKLAFKRFLKHDQDKFNKFSEENSFWLDNYSEYMILKTKFNMRSRELWNKYTVKNREYFNFNTEEIQYEILYWKFLQFKFYGQWKNLKYYANSLDIKIIGDLPIYVSADSSDVWANPELFLLDESFKPLYVAGCPPDAFSKTGQLWGNPIYDWDYHKKTDYTWWICRIKNALNLFDVLRLDHFRAFDSYYSIPYGEKTAVNGKWEIGPGIEFFNTLKKNLGEIPIIAEDLGLLTESVRELLKKTGFPGMKVMQFAFDPNEESQYLPHNHIKNSVVYTGTHDNDTIIGWVDSLKDEELKFIREYLQIEGAQFNWKLIKSAYSSVCNLVIIPMQDFLGFSSDCRMNKPSTTENNWRWRVESEFLTQNLSNKIKDIARVYFRGQ